MKILELLKIILIFPISILLFSPPSFSMTANKPLRGIFLIPEHTGEKWLNEISHYYNHLDLNGVVIHAKTTRGRVYWNSKNQTAIATGAVQKNFNIKKNIDFFKEKQIWTIAKLDIFLDTNLAEKLPKLSLKDKNTEKPWKNKKGLAWTNPFDKRVWIYNIDLAKELALMGFDEIQLDYIRFPSDGVLKNINYPKNRDSMSDTIEAFLKYAKKELAPYGVIISIDIFGLTAWKKSDFGVGQVIEKISPHVDILCPMFYPSHYPSGFLGFDQPSQHPGTIVEKSMEKILKRTDKEVRPWIQSFNYTPEQIISQIEAVEKTGVKSFFAWNASTKYRNFYKAVEKISRVKTPEFLFYKSIDQLKKKDAKIIKGKTRVINYTDYLKGFTIFSLEKSTKNFSTPFSTPILVFKTFDEAILDRILESRGEKIQIHSGKYYKALRVSFYFSKETGRELTKIRPEYYRIQWGDNGRFHTAPEVPDLFFQGRK